jgi:glycine cleavage system aminomethyltransferase T
MMASSVLPAHRDLKRRLKFLASGNHLRQQIAENTLRRMENGLARAIRTAKNDFIGQRAEAYRSHKERDFHKQLIGFCRSKGLQPRGGTSRCGSIRQ